MKQSASPLEDLPEAKPLRRVVPEAVGRYRIQRELGRGMMGVVYLARDPDLGRDIALKVIQLPPGASETDRARFELRFFAEAQSAARLTHPGIVTVHDVGRDPTTGGLYMALQLVPGQTLDNLLKERGILDWKTALGIARTLALSLDHAHSEGVVHRDVKPANIMILPSGEPKLMDFGIARLETSTLTAAGQFLGTPLYMSPEQAMARPLDGRSDIFSLGSVIYEMLTGGAPFAGDSVTRILVQVMDHDVAPPSTLNSSAPPAIDSVLRRCLAKEAAGRYANAGELASDLDAILDGRTPGGAAIPPRPEFAETMRAHRPSAPPPAMATTLAPAPAPNRKVGNGPGEGAWIPRRLIGFGLGALALGGLIGGVWHFAADPPVARLIPEPPLPTPRSARAPTDPGLAAAASVDPEAPALLAVDFEHSLKTGSLRIYVDDLKVVDQPIDGRVTRKVAGLEIRKGRVLQTLEVTPGRRQVHVQVAWDDNIRDETSEIKFGPGQKLRLKAKLGGLGGLRKNLSLDWQ